MVGDSEFGVADYLRTRKEIMYFLEDAAEDPDPTEFAHAVRTVERALRKHSVVDDMHDGERVPA